ncbi:microfibrillar-associated protein 2 isoform X2 [Crotalus tigris]|nr:microfibrillar-associated protein 2 isoform X2 [Crotalus tigris]
MSSRPCARLSLKQASVELQLPPGKTAGKSLAPLPREKEVGIRTQEGGCCSGGLAPSALWKVRPRRGGRASQPEREKDHQAARLQFSYPQTSMRTLLALLLLCLPAALLAQGQYDLDDPAYPEPPYAPYEIESQDYYDYAGNDLSPQTPEEHFQSQQQNQQEVIPAPTPDCQEEQYPCTRLYSIYKPCKQCLNEICFYSLRRVYVINKEICVRTVCAHEELLRADLCRDRFSKCGIMATSGLCQTMATSCARSCGGC